MPSTRVISSLPLDGIPPIERAIAFAGSQTRLGEATGFSQAAINKAKRRGRVSAEMALAIHRVTGGAIAASELRPDLWSRDDGAASPFAESASLPADRRSPPHPRPRPPVATVTNLAPGGGRKPP
jgi:DNA-binding transcriptional regulator YdaS (Cro superfamily)